MSLYPVNLDVRDQLCIIVGGGTVASRKIESLLPCGAKICVISPLVVTRIAERAEDGLLELKQREYRRGDLLGAKLVFAATNSRPIQKQIVTEANVAGILVNVADMPESCTFQVPASCRRGDLLLTVATGGGSPALAARIRKELERSYGPEYMLLVDLMATLRKQIVGVTGDATEHKQLFEKLLDSEILNCIRQQQWIALSKILQDMLPQEIDVARLLEKTLKHFKKEMV
ncbi:MAG: bifunctional precorrin-2 dehydrogenase/sirohydrochlorin ferrochelatase [Desulfocapsa sp.]|nr:bifunctional precorrin-2 dehydrogenase/sirohydrochlorin ferrochelatase [Desulfocapsa sp.]MBN4048645.1 bifunctional precorrin-2 dehydrogenase/sirohydrochlorin ferrochelatase [bacterium AH-315-N22]